MAYEMRIVDVTEETIRIRVKDPDDFTKDSFRTVTISEDKGIKSVMGKLKSDPEGSMVVQSYMFDKNKWTVEEAKKWVEDHKRSISTHQQRRYGDFEMRLAYESGPPKIVGYAAVFDKPSEEFFPGFSEMVSRGAFKKTIEKDDIRALWNHNQDYVLGRNKSRTLKLSEDSKGLTFEIIPPDTSWARDLMTLIKRGDVSQTSFGFDIIKQEQQIDNEKKRVTRILKEVRLYDVSPVTFPAYPQTEVHVRMIQDENESIYLFEDSDEAVILPADRRSVDEMTDEELFKRFESLKEAAFKK